MSGLKTLIAWLIAAAVLASCKPAPKKKESPLLPGATTGTPPTTGIGSGTGQTPDPGVGTAGVASPGPSSSISPSPSQSGGTGSPGTGSFSGNGPGKFVTDFQFSGNFFTQNNNFKLGTSPHKSVRIWYSKNIQNGIKQTNFGPVPPGTVAIKEFDNDNQAGVDGYAVMIKEEKGYDSANGDWNYELRDRWGDIINGQRGRVQECITCHSKFSSTDYLGGTQFAQSNGGTNNGSGSSGSSGSNGPGAFQSNYATSTNFFTRMSGMRSGSSDSVHGNIQIWYSKNIQAMVEDDDSIESVPVGTVAVKRYQLSRTSTDKCRPQTGTAVMIKQTASGANNGWKFEIRNSLGAEIPDCANELSNCANCHARATRRLFNESDYLMGTRIDD